MPATRQPASSRTLTQQRFVVHPGGGVELELPNLMRASRHGESGEKVGARVEWAQPPCVATAIRPVSHRLPAFDPRLAELDFAGIGRQPHPHSLQISLLSRPCREDVGYTTGLRTVVAVSQLRATEGHPRHTVWIA